MPPQPATAATGVPSALLARRSPASEYTLTQRASLTAVASLLDYASKLAVGIVITPLLVGYLGRSLFGTWEVLVRVVGYLSAVDGRPMDALRLVLGNRHAISDDAANRRTVGMALAVWVLYLPIVIIAGAVITWLAPSLAKTPPELVRDVRITTALLGLNAVLTMLVALPEAVLFGVNQGYRRMGLVASANVFGAVVTAGAVRAGFGLPGLAVAQIALTVATGVLFLMLVRRYVAWFGIARPWAKELRSFVTLSGWSLAAETLSKVLLTSDAILLGLLASTAAVTSYVLTGYAAQAVIGILTLALGAVVPGLGTLVGQHDYERAAAVRGEMLAISWVAATVVGATILMWNRAFLHLWVGPGHYAGASANLLIVLAMVQTVFIRADAYVINALLELRARVLISVPAAAMTCVLAVLLVPRFDITGMCISVIAGRMTQSIAYPLRVNAALERTQLAALPAVTRPAVVMLLLFAVAGMLGERVTSATWVTWFLGTSSSGGAFLAIAVVAGLHRHYRRPLLSRVRAMALPVWRTA